MPNPMTVDEFVDKIAKPTWNLRMARGNLNAMHNDLTKNQRKEYERRQHKARVEIDLLIREYMGETEHGV